MTALTFFFMPAQTTLYTAELDAIVELPAGYFLLQNSQISPDGYISVTYDDISGFVKATDVQAVDYTPVTKYETTVKFKCDNDGQPVNLRAAPHRSAEIAAVLSPTDVGHSYGSIVGDALIAGAGDKWYYVSSGGVRGYCYSAHVSVEATPPNIIEKEPDPEPSDPTITEPTPDNEPKTMSNVTAVIFIVALCIPVPFIMFYLFKKPKNTDRDDTDGRL